MRVEFVVEPLKAGSGRLWCRVCGEWRTWIQAGSMACGECVGIERGPSFDQLLVGKSGPSYTQVMRRLGR